MRPCEAQPSVPTLEGPALLATVSRRWASVSVLILPHRMCKIRARQSMTSRALEAFRRICSTDASLVRKPLTLSAPRLHKQKKLWLLLACDTTMEEALTILGSDLRNWRQLSSEQSDHLHELRANPRIVVCARFQQEIKGCPKWVQAPISAKTRKRRSPPAAALLTSLPALALELLPATLTSANTLVCTQS